MASDQFRTLRFGLLTVSDTRTLATDTSGAYLLDAVTRTGHELGERAILVDDIYLLRAKVSGWLVDPKIDVIITTGGTGMTGRDVVPEALTPLLAKHIDGFGELFRHFSLEDIGTSTIQSRAFAGLANGRLVFCLPGSTGACRLAWEKILMPQLDSRTKPCNFVDLIPRFMEK